MITVESREQALTFTAGNTPCEIYRGSSSARKQDTGCKIVFEDGELASSAILRRVSNDRIPVRRIIGIAVDDEFTSSVFQDIVPCSRRPIIHGFQGTSLEYTTIIKIFVLCQKRKKKENCDAVHRASNKFRTFNSPFFCR